MSGGRKTKRLKFNLFERGRKHSGVDRSNVDMKSMINLINAPDIQEHVKAGTLRGYNGHEIRQRYGMNPPDTVIIDGKVVNLTPSFRTIEFQAESNGDVSHVAEFFDNDQGEWALRQYKARAGGFSSAQNYKRQGLGLIAVAVFGFDYVTQPNYVTNVGDGQLFDGLAIPAETEGLISCFDSATDVSLLSPAEAMLANMLEQQIVRSFDSIHASLNMQIQNDNALEQIAVLNEQLFKRERVQQIQQQRQQELYSSMVGEIRSFDSACAEATHKLQQSDIAHKILNGEKIKPAVGKRRFKVWGS
ncbi:hypothetical protein [Acinetobacter chinensis]|uniref:hypothetical protein n=1 Tax=Acinetobacter chinensis TaxID=2004650 RepID=UPI0029351707|nr:hypothetical protein [Acinetobacter chinensis]WOE40069.1 hypothetical protein QSG87_09095 [Acinetobacter chinensis]